MRVSTNSISEAVLAQIQKLGQRQSQLQSQVATGQKVFRPEDDPSAVGRILLLDTESRATQQFQVNANRALELSQATYAGLQEIKKISDRAGEVSTLGAGTSSPDGYRAYAKEVNQLIEQTLQLTNTRLRNEYLYAGTSVDTAPFSVTRDANGDVTLSTPVAYNGDGAQTKIQLSELSSISPGTSGAVNLGLRDFITNLVNLRDALISGSSVAVAATQPALEASENVLVNALSEQGAVQLRVEISKTQQQTRVQNLEKLVSDEADADMATSVVRLSQTSTAYEAALSSATRILQMSLLDYLK